MSHVTYEWVMSHKTVNDFTLCGILPSLIVSRVTCEWVMSRMNESFRIKQQNAVLCAGFFRLSFWVVSHVNESRHIWMSRDTQDCKLLWFVLRLSLSIVSRKFFASFIVSHVTGESWHIQMSHVTYEWVTSHMNKSCHIKTAKSCTVCRLLPSIIVSRVTCEWVTSHMNVSCRIKLLYFVQDSSVYHYQSCPVDFFASLIMSHVTGESWHIWMSHHCQSCPVRVIAHMNESRRVQMSHATYGNNYNALSMNESRRMWKNHVKYECVTSHVNQWWKYGKVVSHKTLSSN